MRIAILLSVFCAMLSACQGTPPDDERDTPHYAPTLY